VLGASLTAGGLASRLIVPRRSRRQGLRAGLRPVLASALRAALTAALRRDVFDSGNPALRPLEATPDDARNTVWRLATVTIGVTDHG
jgi:hypothetical protein